MATAIIPAYNEAPRVGAVVGACLAAASVDQVLVVDDGSSDDTAAAARAAGAAVIEQANGGIGAAIVAGAMAARSLLAVRLDADLAGLAPDDVDRLVAPVEAGVADMTVAAPAGVKGPLWWSGQRALPVRWLLEAPGLAEARYGADMVLTRYARELHARIVLVDWSGVRSAEKTAKWGLAKAARLGLAAKLAGVENWESSTTLGIQAGLVGAGILLPGLAGWR